jgi:release factor glutamine methyltransferase
MASRSETTSRVAELLFFRYAFRMTVHDLIEAATDRLKRARIDHARLEAESLLAFILTKDLAWPLAHPEADVSAADTKRFATLVGCRARRIPFAYLVGRQGFYGRDFLVTFATLIPRPETELLVEGLLAKIPSDRPAIILDIGTGSGAIGLTFAAERPDARVQLYDNSLKALAVARMNARRLKLARRVRAVRIDILRQRLPEPLSRRSWVRAVLPDVIVAANLPYLPFNAWKRTQPEVRAHEPKSALVSGEDGLTHYRALFRTLAKWKRKPRLLGIEAEPDQLRGLAADWSVIAPGGRIEILKDLHGDDRVMIAVTP